MIFAREILNDHIHCIQDGSDAIGAKISEPAFDSYCYISDTFTLPKVVTDQHDLPYPGNQSNFMNDHSFLGNHVSSKENIQHSLLFMSQIFH